VIFLGDLVDRGPASDVVLETAMSMVDAGSALCILGNHENKLARALAGRNVTVSHGLAETLEQLEARTPEFRQQVATFIDGLLSHYVLDRGRLVVAHAGLPERYHGRTSGRVRALAMYGDTDGETDEFGLPIRYPWADDYRGDASVVYGHTPVPETEWHNNTICLDTGVVHGGHLTALRWPEKELVSVEAAKVYYEPFRPLVAEQPERPPRLLDVEDVLGKHHIETSLARRVTIEEERSSAAIEVMSRFATDPRWLVYLPPTMAPVATSSRDDFLEHPDEAFSYFAQQGVDQVVCQEKHMGSRAVVVIARSADVAQARFGLRTPAAGVIVTRTGRPFFNAAATTAALLGRLRSALDRSGLWTELESDWLVFDAELLPWSAKAQTLITDQYAAAGAAGETMLQAATSALTQAHDRLSALDGTESDLAGPSTPAGTVAEILARTGRRAEHVERYRQAYRTYCWATEDLEGLELAPFQILAGEREVFARRPHHWHLACIDRLVEADPELLRKTGRRTVELGDETQVAEATAWWHELTDNGGEGMVVKPADAIVVSERGLVLPGVKCRGREYLRIVYGPEYLEPANLDRLRQRGLGRKSSLARREFALGIEALDRFVGRQHLHRVHECVFGVLALESEPVDPRL
jgi:polynucleotide kinase-phosphatase